MCSRWRVGRQREIARSRQHSWAYLSWPTAILTVRRLLLLRLLLLRRSFSLMRSRDGECMCVCAIALRGPSTAINASRALLRLLLSYRDSSFSCYTVHACEIYVCCAWFFFFILNRRRDRSVSSAHQLIFRDNICSSNSSRSSLPFFFFCLSISHCPTCLRVSDVSCVLG